MDDRQRQGLERLVERLERDERYERSARRMTVAAWTVTGLGVITWAAVPIVAAVLLGLAGVGLILAVTLRARSRRFE